MRSNYSLKRHWAAIGIVALAVMALNTIFGGNTVTRVRAGGPGVETVCSVGSEKQTGSFLTRYGVTVQHAQTGETFVIVELRADASQPSLYPNSTEIIGIAVGGENARNLALSQWVYPADASVDSSSPKESATELAVNAFPFPGVQSGQYPRIVWNGLDNTPTQNVSLSMVWRVTYSQSYSRALWISFENANGSEVLGCNLPDAGQFSDVTWSDNGVAGRARVARIPGNIDQFVIQLETSSAVDLSTSAPNEVGVLLREYGGTLLDERYPQFSTVKMATPGDWSAFDRFVPNASGRLNGAEWPVDVFSAGRKATFIIEFLPSQRCTPRRAVVWDGASPHQLAMPADCGTATPSTATPTTTKTPSATVTSTAVPTAAKPSVTATTGTDPYPAPPGGGGSNPHDFGCGKDAFCLGVTTVFKSSN